jgi:hypothetical protein
MLIQPAMALTCGGCGAGTMRTVGRMWSDAREAWRGEEYVVRRVSGSAAGKHYRCPGCDQEIPGAVPHVVAWPEYDAAAEHRRHWHTPCWSARDRRAPNVERSRNAPRYG